MMGNRRKNILLSTTRQWNPGDEFIRISIESLIEEASGWDINWLIYDRNPDIRNCRLPNISNSFFEGTAPYVDMIVLAGTSEWAGPFMTELYRYSLRFSVPVLAIGIGTPGFKVSLSRLEEHIFKAQTPLIIVRDRATADMLYSYGVQSFVMPCPSLISPIMPSYPSQINSLAIIWQFVESNQACTIGKGEALSALCNELRKTGYEVSIVVHYVEELQLVHGLNLECDVYYSYEPRAYLDLLRQFDAVVGLRLHGCLLALSLGRPAVLVPHDERTFSAAREVPTLSVCSFDQVVSRLSLLAAGLPDWCRRNEIFLARLRKEYKARIHEACVRCLR